MHEPDDREALIMAEIRHALSEFFCDKSNCYSMLMVLTTLAFLAFMAAGTAAIQVSLNLEAPSVDWTPVSAIVRYA